MPAHNARAKKGEKPLAIISAQYRNTENIAVPLKKRSCESYCASFHIIIIGYLTCFISPICFLFFFVVFFFVVVVLVLVGRYVVVSQTSAVFIRPKTLLLFVSNEA